MTFLHTNKEGGVIVKLYRYKRISLISIGRINIFSRTNIIGFECMRTDNPAQAVPTSNSCLKIGNPLVEYVAGDVGRFPHCVIAYQQYFED